MLRTKQYSYLGNSEIWERPLDTQTISLKLTATINSANQVPRIRKHFTHPYLFFPQNPWVPIYAFQKSVGFMEPTLTKPLHKFSMDPCLQGKSNF